MPVYMAETKFSTNKAGYSALSCVTAILCTHYFFSFMPSLKASPTRSVTL